MVDGSITVFKLSSVLQDADNRATMTTQLEWSPGFFYLLFYFNVLTSVAAA